MNFEQIERSTNKKIHSKLKQHVKETHEGIRAGYLALRRDLIEEARRLIREPPKTGRIYLVRIRGKLRNHQASAPGQSPADMTGALRRSIGAEQRGWDELIFGADTPYAPELELGSEQVEPRPYLIRAINNNRRNARAHFERELEKRLSC